MKRAFYRIGHVAKLYRVKGEVVVAFNNPIADELKNIDFLFIERVKKPVPYYVENYKLQSDTNAIVKFEDIDDRTEAGHFLKKNIFLTEDKLQALSSEDWQYDLLPGFKVIDKEKGVIGEIESVVNVPQQYLLKVIYKGKEVLIPFHEDILVKVDDENKIIYLDLPKGLL